MNFIPILLDVILVIIVIACIVDGFKKGFLKTFVTLIGELLSIVFAVYLSKPIADYFYNNFLSEKIISAINNAFASSNQLEAITDMLSKPFFVFASKIGGSISPEQAVAAGADNVIATVANGIMSNLAGSLIRAATFIILLVIIRIVVSLITRALGFVRHLPIVGSVDGVLGAAVGLIKAALVIMVISILVYIVIMIFPNQFINEQTLESTYLFKFVNDNNPIITALF